MKTQKAIAWITAVTGVGVALVTGILVAGYWEIRVRKELLITLPPVLIPASLSILAVMALVSRSTSRKRNGAMTGMCVGSLLYLIFPAIQLAQQYDMLARDGTGFWSVLMVPSVLLGIPLPILGALLGGSIGFLKEARSRPSKS